MMEDTQETADALTLIFKQLNLNERANVRLVSKRFQNLCDSIEIRTLVIFENAVPSAGKLVYTGEEYDLVDTVSVGDLQKLFDNQPIMQQMRPIETLVIHGCYLNHETNVYELKSQFSELIHLELYNIHITSSHIVSCSENLRYLKLYNVILKSREFFEATLRDYKLKIDEHQAKQDRTFFIDDRGNTNPTFLFLGLETLKNASLEYFSTDFAFDMPSFFVDCINSDIFQGLVQIDLVAYDLDNLGLLIEKSPYLRVIKLRYYMLSRLFDQIGTTEKVKRIMSQFRDGLSVYLYNLLWNSQTVEKLFEFLGDLMEIPLPGNREVLGVHGEGDLDLVVSSSVYEYFNGLDEQKAELAKRFYQEIGCVQTSTELIERDKAFFSQFRNCAIVNLDVNTLSIECLSAFANLVTVRLEFQMVKYDDKVLDPVEESCDLVQHLTVVLCNKVNNFDFLFELKCLKSINLLLYYPIDPKVVVQLINELKYLQKLSVCFVKPSRLDKKKLLAFRMSVNETFSEKFKAKDLQFLVNVYTKREWKIVQFLLDKTKSIENNKQLLDSEENMMFRFAAQNMEQNEDQNEDQN